MLISILPPVTSLQSASLSQAGDADQVRLLEVVINGRSRNRVAQFWLREGVLATTPGELHELGIRSPAGLIARPRSVQPAAADTLISISRLTGLSWRLDQQTQTLYVTATDQSLLPAVLRERTEGTGQDQGEDQAPHRTVDSGTGLTLNYDLSATDTGGQITSSSSLDLRLFSPRGVASSGLLLLARKPAPAAVPGAAQQGAIRLDTTYTFADRAANRRYTLGDFVTGGLAWTRPVRLAGLQLRSDFSMRPDLITFPLPSLNGSAAVPSTVDVLANGGLVFSQEVGAGPFEIPRLPVINGASTISMTVTNALGQQVTVNQPFYASNTLLAPGLATCSAQAGLVRRQWGTASNDFGKLAGVADYRRGLTRTLTLEASAEGTPGAASAGAGAIFAVRTLGVLNASAAASAGPSARGEQATLGFVRIGPRFSLGASALLSTRSFEDVAARNGSPVPRRQLSASGGVNLRRFGSLGMAYAEIRQDASLHPLPPYPALAQHARTLSASYAFELRPMSIFVNQFRSFTGAGGGIEAGVVIPLGRRSSVTLSEGAGEGYGQLQVHRSAAEIGDWGYDASASANQDKHVFAQVEYRSHSSLLTAGIDQNGGRTTLRAESQGAVSYLDHALFASNAIFDSFAVVDTGGQPDVRVLEENRVVGKTGTSGRLLVPNLRAFDLNHLGINATDVPLDVTVDSDTQEIRPQDHSGVVVRFRVKISSGALLRLVDDTGTPLPVGSVATLRGSSTAYPVGYAGEAYLEDLRPFNQVEAELPSGAHCGVSFPFVPLKGLIPTVGPLRCLEVQP